MTLKRNQFNPGVNQADVWLKHIYPGQLIQEEKKKAPDVVEPYLPQKF